MACAPAMNPTRAPQRSSGGDASYVGAAAAAFGPAAARVIGALVSAELLGLGVCYVALEAEGLTALLAASQHCSKNTCFALAAALNRVAV